MTSWGQRNFVITNQREGFPTTAYYAAPVTANYAPTTAYYAPTVVYYPTSAYYAPAVEDL